MSGVYTGVECTGKGKKKRKGKKCGSKFKPNPHQIRVLDHFITSPHKIGSGKTCTSIMVADRLLQTKRIKRVFVLTPRSLRQNWVDEYCKICQMNDSTLTYGDTSPYPISMLLRHIGALTKS